MHTIQRTTKLKHIAVQIILIVHKEKKNIHISFKLYIVALCYGAKYLPEWGSNC